MNTFVYLALGLIIFTVWSNTSAPLQEGQKSFTLYYSMGCPHCIKVMPEWLKLGASYGGTVIRKVQTHSGSMEYPIQGVPTIVYRSGDGLVEEYKGGRTASDFIQFLAST